MKNTPKRFLVSSMNIENDAKTGRLSLDFQGGGRSAEFELLPNAATHVFGLLLLRLMERPEEDVQKALQVFALKSIEAKLHVDGTPYLDYTLECGTRYGSALPREWLEALYHQLGDVLGSPLPSSKGTEIH